MFVSNNDLKSKLLQAYEGDGQAKEEFFDLVFRICAEIAKTHTYFRMTDTIDDFASFASISVYRQFQRRQIDPTRNIHCFLMTGAKLRILDYLRKATSVRSRDCIVYNTLVDEMKRGGIRGEGEEELCESLMA